MSKSRNNKHKLSIIVGTIKATENILTTLIKECCPKMEIWSTSEAKCFIKKLLQRYHIQQKHDF